MNEIQMEALKQAIKDKKPISFDYIKEGKVEGKRFGDPHAVFVLSTLSGVQSTKVHIVQTSGVSDSKNEHPLPDFRLFDINSIENVQVLEEEPCFTVNEKYNSEWEGYKKIVVKVS